MTPANESRRLVRHPSACIRPAHAEARKWGAQLRHGRPGQGSTYLRTAIIQYAPRAVGVMEIENLFRYPALAVGLKPSARQGKTRLRGLKRIIYSKSIGSPETRAIPLKLLPCRGRFLGKPLCIAPKNALLERGRLLIICADPSYPCQSVFYSGAPRQSPPARARADDVFKDHSIVPAVRRAACDAIWIVLCHPRWGLKGCQVCRDQLCSPFVH